MKKKTKKTTKERKTKKKPVSRKKVSKKKETKKKAPSLKKRVAPVKKVKKITEKEKVKPTRYFEAVGRRKSSVARVRLFTQGDKTLTINDKPYDNYFSTLELQQIAISSLRKMKCEERFRVSVKVKGGGIHSQAEAVRHGIARALLNFNPDFRKRLRKAGFITRDPRVRERKKFGLKRARRAPQWSKR